ncbi:hypothetical protein HELRODRAFT_173725 [Helobdella robusta]|uniref:Uncharacterized protein n=1 Tax=Helobdella robusta TaxID=6412 RepID=T1F760_HELRO|nr:hypothetical protein HELRODRAFT_173725 [Helobdella robusta]ESO03429.1 hypothetical protein HELRODRAFT_173725 [Helobdella robusta]
MTALARIRTTLIVSLSYLALASNALQPPTPIETLLPNITIASCCVTGDVRIQIGGGATICGLEITNDVYDSRMLAVTVLREDFLYLLAVVNADKFGVDLARGHVVKLWIVVYKNNTALKVIIPYRRVAPINLNRIYRLHVLVWTLNNVDDIIPPYSLSDESLMDLPTFLTSLRMYNATLKCVHHLDVVHQFARTSSGNFTCPSDSTFTNRPTCISDENFEILIGETVVFCDAGSLPNVNGLKIMRKPGETICQQNLCLMVVTENNGTEFIRRWVASFNRSDYYQYSKYYPPTESGDHVFYIHIFSMKLGYLRRNPAGKIFHWSLEKFVTENELCSSAVFKTSLQFKILSDEDSVKVNHTNSSDLTTEANQLTNRAAANAYEDEQDEVRHFTMTTDMSANFTLLEDKLSKSKRKVRRTTIYRTPSSAWSPASRLYILTFCVQYFYFRVINEIFCTYRFQRPFSFQIFYSHEQIVVESNRRYQYKKTKTYA